MTYEQLKKSPYYRPFVPFYNGDVFKAEQVLRLMSEKARKDHEDEPYCMSEPTFTVERVKNFSRKDYEEADGDGNFSFRMDNVLFNKYPNKDDYYLLGLNADNRQRFKAHWGKQNFCFRSEFFFRGWVFRVNFQSEDQAPKEIATYFVLTAKGKGTVYERTGGTKLLYSEISPCEQAFINWMEKELTHMPIII